MKKIAPTAVEITSWHPYKEIIYKCSNCGQDFRIFGTKERFCHNCGKKVDWDGVPTTLKEPFNKNNAKEEKKLIQAINKLIQSK